MTRGDREVRVGVATDQTYISDALTPGDAQDPSRIPDESAIFQGVIAAGVKHTSPFAVRQIARIIQEQQPIGPVAVVGRWPEDASSIIALKIALLDMHHVVVTQPNAGAVSGHLVVGAVR
jgi:hypothetical protein